MPIDKNPGYLVETSSGKKGRTFHNEGLVNNKRMVYLCIKEEYTRIPGHKICVEFSKKGLLVRPETIKIIGFID